MRPISDVSQADSAEVRLTNAYNCVGTCSESERQEGNRGLDDVEIL